MTWENLLAFLLPFLPPFFGVLAAFLIQRGWSWAEDRRNRKKIRMDIKKELKLCSDRLVGEGQLLPTDMWKSIVSSGLLRLLPYNLKMELASIYFSIENHNYEAEKVRDVGILAETTKAEKPKAEVGFVQGERITTVRTPWTHAQLLWDGLSKRLRESEKTLQKEINKLLEQRIWD